MKIRNAIQLKKIYLHVILLFFTTDIYAEKKSFYTIMDHFLELFQVNKTKK